MRRRVLSRIGDRSMPILQPTQRRIGANTGSVTRSKNCTIGFQGSGFTQEIKALAMITHI